MPLANHDGQPLSIGFVGAGQMGGAMIKGLVKAEACRAEHISVFDVRQDAVASLQATCPGLKSVADSSAVCSNAEMVVIAVEPKDAPMVCAELAKTPGSAQKVYVSLCAGVTLKSLAGWLQPPVGSKRSKSDGDLKMARVMPNTPCVVQEQAAGYICSAACSAADAAMVGSMLGALGSALKVHEESDLDAVTGVSGSGPAYVFQVTSTPLTLARSPSHSRDRLSHSTSRPPRAPTPLVLIGPMPILAVLARSL